jgi:hypothetical protein
MSASRAMRRSGRAGSPGRLRLDSSRSHATCATSTRCAASISTLAIASRMTISESRRPEHDADAHRFSKPRKSNEIAYLDLSSKQRVNDLLAMDSRGAVRVAVHPHSHLSPSESTNIRAASGISPHGTGKSPARGHGGRPGVVLQTSS